MGNFIYTILSLLDNLSWKTLKNISTIFGYIFWYLLPKRRNKTILNISERLNISTNQAKIIAKASFIHAARSFFEILLTRRIDPRYIQKCVKFEYDKNKPNIFEHPADRPAVVVSGHIGAWELLNPTMQPYVEQMKVKQVVVRLPKNKALADLIVHYRTMPNMEVVPHRNAAKNVIRCLRQNGVTCFLVDHNTKREEALFVPFLGKLAAVNVGPALLALKMDAIIYPIFLLRGEGQKFIFWHAEGLDTKKLIGEREEKINKIIEFYTNQVEIIVKKYPEQWFWMHNRWKTQPK